MMEEMVVLVSENDEVLGQMEKMAAHENGILHRAFSVFLFNDNGEMLLQKRATRKYHSPGQWTNAVCSHPRIHVTFLEGAKRPMMEEMRIEAEIEANGHSIYKAEVGNGLLKHELDRVFVGTY